MLIGIAVIAAAGIAGLIAGYVLWRAAQFSGLWNLFAGVLLGALVIVIAILIALLMVKSRRLI